MSYGLLQIHAERLDPPVKPEDDRRSTQQGSGLASCTAYKFILCKVYCLRAVARTLYCLPEPCAELDSGLFSLDSETFILRSKPTENGSSE